MHECKAGKSGRGVQWEDDQFGRELGRVACLLRVLGYNAGGHLPLLVDPIWAAVPS